MSVLRRRSIFAAGAYLPAARDLPSLPHADRWHGRYHLVKEEDGELRPKKDKYSNLCDCLQYGCLSLGEGRRMVGLHPASEAKAVCYRPQRKSMRRIIA
jgi:hypothetical protein